MVRRVLLSLLAFAASKVCGLDDFAKIKPFLPKPGQPVRGLTYGQIADSKPIMLQDKFQEHFDEVEKMRKRQNPFNSSFACANSNNAIEGAPCQDYSHCYYYEAFRTGANYYNFRSAFSQYVQQFNYTCENNKCVRIKRGKEGDNCITLPSSTWWMIPPGSTCEHPFICSSGKCQRPLSNGCGPCNQDPNACLPGLVCDSQSNMCQEKLSVGSKCILSTYAAQQTYINGTIGTTMAWVDSWLPCGGSQINQTYWDQKLFCNYTSRNCEMYPTVFKLGDRCESNYQGCPSGSYCTYNQTAGVSTCQAQVGLGGSCTDRPCQNGLYCIGPNYANATCRNSFNYLPEGAVCGDSSWYQYGLCGEGLFCNGTFRCDKAKLPGEACTHTYQCAGFSSCVSGKCSALYSLPAGSQCSDTFSYASSCVPGTFCSGTCQNLVGNPCDWPEACSYYGGDYTCKCNSTFDSPSNPLGKATCQAAAPFQQNSPLMKVMQACLEQYRTPWIEVQNSFWGRSSTISRKITCCLINNMTAPYFGDIYFTWRAIYEFFGYDNVALNCGVNPPQYVTRQNNCTNGFGSNYDFNTGIRALAGSPGAPAYSGVPTIPRYALNPNSTFTSSSSSFVPTSTSFTPTSTSSSSVPTSTTGGSGGIGSVTYPAIQSTQASALMDLFNSTNGCSWINKNGWASPSCASYGVTCDSNGNVVKLVLARNNLAGVIPSSISKLTYLQEFVVSTNRLTGGFPSGLCSLSYLRVIDLGDNYFSDVIDGACFSSMTYLRAFDVHRNLFSGAIPYSLGYSSSLTIILLNDNKFTGAIPSTFSYLGNVTIYDSSSNNLNATTFPPSNICSLCERKTTRSDVTGCTTTIVGYLSSASCPQAWTVSRNPSSFGDGSYSVPAAVKQAISQLPFDCRYRF